MPLKCSPSGGDAFGAVTPAQGLHFDDATERPRTSESIVSVVLCARDPFLAWLMTWVC